MHEYMEKTSNGMDASGPDGAAEGGGEEEEEEPVAMEKELTEEEGKQAKGNVEYLTYVCLYNQSCTTYFILRRI